MVLFFAGYENAVNLLGRGTLALLRHPGQWTALRDNSALAGNAIDETLHYDAPLWCIHLIGQLRGHGPTVVEIRDLAVGDRSGEPIVPQPDQVGRPGGEWWISPVHVERLTLTPGSHHTVATVPVVIEEV